MRKFLVVQCGGAGGLVPQSEWGTAVCRRSTLTQPGAPRGANEARRVTPPGWAASASVAPT